MKFYDEYNDFYITVKDDLTVKSKYIKKSEEAKQASGKINLDESLKKNINVLESARGKSESPTEEQIEYGGDLLFKALFPEEIGVDFGNAYDEIDDKKSVGLRILLDIAPSLTDFPWEIARYQGKFLATEIKTPFLRIFDGKTKGTNLGEGKMPRVLSILSNVEDRYAVDVAGEHQNLKQIILEDPNRVNFGGFKDVVKDAKTEASGERSGNPSLDDIRDFLDSTRADPKEDPFNIIHFLSHGNFDNEKNVSTIVLQPSREEKMRHIDEIEASGSQLAETFGDERSIGLVILNACSSARIPKDGSGLVPELLKIAPAVVAMRKGIEKDTAKEFTYHFYKYFTPQNAEAAIQTARKAMLKKIPKTIDFSIPVLYLGCDKETRIPANRIFEKTTASAQQWTPATILSPAGYTIITLLELHDKSIRTEAQWNDWFENQDKLDIFKKMTPPQIKDFLSVAIFGEFNKALQDISRLIHGAFCHAVPTWEERCNYLDLDLKKLADVLSQGKQQEITPVTYEWKQNYKNIEKLISHVVTAGKEVP
jgi:hypothetical protein